MPERLGGWRIKHEVSFGYADAADISFLSNYVTTLTLSQLCHNKRHKTLSQQTSQLCHNKCHKNNVKNIDGEW